MMGDDKDKGIKQMHDMRVLDGWHTYCEPSNINSLSMKTWIQNKFRTAKNLMILRLVIFSTHDGFIWTLSYAQWA